MFGRRPKSFWRLFLLLVAAWPAGADEFHLFQQRVSAGESGEVTVNVWKVGSSRFQFLPLRGWQVQGDEAAVALTMKSPDQGASIVWRLLSDCSSATNATAVISPVAMRNIVAVTNVGELSDNLSISNAVAMSNDFRPKLQERYPDGEILSEFPCHVAGGRGVAWDIRRIIPQKAVLQTRVLRVIHPACLMEFELTAMLQKFPEHEVTFRALLSSIRIEPEPVRDRN